MRYQGVGSTPLGIRCGSKTLGIRRVKREHFVQEEGKKCPQVCTAGVQCKKRCSIFSEVLRIEQSSLSVVMLH